MKWETYKHPLRGASRMALGRLQLHDTQSEVREVIRTAVEAIEWRSRVVRAVTSFVTALEAHQRTGISQANRQVERCCARWRGAMNLARLEGPCARHRAAAPGTRFGTG